MTGTINQTPVAKYRIAPTQDQVRAVRPDHLVQFCYCPEPQTHQPTNVSTPSWSALTSDPPHEHEPSNHALPLGKTATQPTQFPCSATAHTDFRHKPRNSPVPPRFPTATNRGSPGGRRYITTRHGPHHPTQQQPNTAEQHIVLINTLTN